MSEPTKEQLLASMTGYKEYLKLYPGGDPNHPPDKYKMSPEGYQRYVEEYSPTDSSSGGYTYLGGGGSGPGYKFYGPDTGAPYPTDQGTSEYLSQKLLPPDPSLWRNMSAPVYQKQDYLG